MHTNTPTTTTGGMDMLAVLERIDVKDNRKLSQEDTLFCEQQQALLDESLDQQKRWYDFFCQEAKNYEQSHQPTFKTSGEIVTHEPYIRTPPPEKRYKDLCFTPFDSINKIVASYRTTCVRFANAIIDYFNETYSLSVENPDPNKNEFSIESRPKYMPYVDKVIEYLGGKGFRTKAEDEIIRRLHKAVHPWPASRVPELKGPVISFFSVFCFDDFWLRNGKCTFSYNTSKNLEQFCAGLTLCDGKLCGDMKIIIGLNDNNVSTDWHDLSTEKARQIRFFKNGRIDVRFSSAPAANVAFLRLRLDTLYQEKK